MSQFVRDEMIVSFEVDGVDLALPLNGKRGMFACLICSVLMAVWAFAMILTCSRMLFVQPVLRMDQSSWCASHVADFEFFGGVPARMVCDNLNTGVDRPEPVRPEVRPRLC